MSSAGGEDIGLVLHIGSIVAGAVFTTVSCCLYFTKALADNRKLFYKVISRHNREDDDNFALLQGSIHQIHMRNAVRDGTQPPEFRQIPRRRYLVSDSDDRYDDEGAAE